MLRGITLVPIWNLLSASSSARYGRKRIEHGLGRFLHLIFESKPAKSYWESVIDRMIGSRPKRMLLDELRSNQGANFTLFTVSVILIFWLIKSIVVIVNSRVTRIKHVMTPNNTYHQILGQTSSTNLPTQLMQAKPPSPSAPPQPSHMNIHASTSNAKAGMTFSTTNSITSPPPPMPNIIQMPLPHRFRPDTADESNAGTSRRE